MGFQQGLSGLNASSRSLDSIGNNIANSGTVGFKSGTAQFADVFAASLTGAGAAPVGLGAKVAAVVQQFTQGNVTVTNNPLDTAINGGGFFQMADASGTSVYTRNGQFQLDESGYIVNAQGLRLQGIMADATGAIATGSPVEPLRLFDPSQSLTGPPQATGGSSSATGIQANVNLDSRQGPPGTSPFSWSNPNTYNQSTAVTVYDSLGNPHTYSMYFVNTATNTWDVYATVTNPDGTVTDLSGGGATVQQTLYFSTSGVVSADLAGAPYVTGTQSITDAELGFPGGVTSPLTFNVDFSGSTQYGSNFSVNALTQDGYASGSLSGFNIGKDGTVLGQYTNGQSKAVGQVILATFRNPQGLQPLGDNVWAVTPNSGPAIQGAPGSTGQYGVLQSAALEDSNVDLTAELVSMITQQRAYQANAQTIKTQDSLLQTLVNLR
jgi:flagellar hook protein FlgE